MTDSNTPEVSEEFKEASPRTKALAILVAVGNASIETLQHFKEGTGDE